MGGVPEEIDAMTDIDDGPALVKRLCEKYRLEFLPDNLEGCAVRLNTSVAYIALRKLELLARAHVEAGRDPDLEYEFKLLESMFTDYLSRGLEHREKGLDKALEMDRVRRLRHTGCPYTREAFDAAVTEVKAPDGTVKQEQLAAAIVKRDGTRGVSRDTLRKYGRPD